MTLVPEFIKNIGNKPKNPIFNENYLNVIKRPADYNDFEKHYNNITKELEARNGVVKESDIFGIYKPFILGINCCLSSEVKYFLDNIYTRRSVQYSEIENNPYRLKIYQFLLNLKFISLVLHNGCNNVVITNLAYLILYPEITSNKYLSEVDLRVCADD